jgi:hypothetical protein
LHLLDPWLFPNLPFGKCQPPNPKPQKGKENEGVGDAVMANAKELPDTLPPLHPDSRRIPHPESRQLPEECLAGGNIARAIHASELNVPGIANVGSHQLMSIRIAPSPRHKAGDKKPEPKRRAAAQAKEATPHELSFFCSRFQCQKSQADQRPTKEKKTVTSGTLTLQPVNDLDASPKSGMSMRRTLNRPCHFMAGARSADVASLKPVAL